MWLLFHFCDKFVFDGTIIFVYVLIVILLCGISVMEQFTMQFFYFEKYCLPSEFLTITCNPYASLGVFGIFDRSVSVEINMFVMKVFVFLFIYFILWRLSVKSCSPVVDKIKKSQFMKIVKYLNISLMSYMV